MTFVAILKFPKANGFSTPNCATVTKRFVLALLMSSHPQRPLSIDVHHHYFPPDLNKAKANEKAQWRAPPGTLPWSAERSISAMDAANIDIAILSVPAIPAMSTILERPTATRQCNIAMKNICIAYPNRFGFFAAAPYLHDVEGALKEIAYALDVLHADGIALASSYGTGSGAKYIGDEVYQAIWSELDKRAAIVFIHGTQTPSSSPCPSPLLGLPITESPNETFKAAAHLVVSGCKRRYPNVRMILAHSGGTTIALAPRVAILSRYMGCALTADQILEDFKTFYYETALSAYEPTLLALEAFVHPSRILFGTDFPAVSAEMADWYTTNLRQFYANNNEKLTSIMSANALRLFPQLYRDNT